MTIDLTLKKAEAALDIILQCDEKNSDCNFKHVLNEILAKWRDLE